MVDILGHLWTNFRFSHGGNTGSNPVGDANKTDYSHPGASATQRSRPAFGQGPSNQRRIKVPTAAASRIRQASASSASLRSAR
jgi:hypothetical protein